MLPENELFHGYSYGPWLTMGLQMAIIKDCPFYSYLKSGFYENPDFFFPLYVISETIAVDLF